MPMTDKRPLDPAPATIPGRFHEEAAHAIAREPAGADRDTIAIGALLSAVWRARRYALIGMICGAVLGGALAFAMTPVYRAQIVAMPVKSQNSPMAGMMGQLGGLAAAAGLDIGPQDNTVEFVEFLKSRTLTQKFITANGLMPVLFRPGWLSKPPTMAGAVRKFNERIRTITQDKRSNVVTLSINWRDREVAAQWANEYVALANRELAARAIADAESSLSYLNKELPQATSIGVQQALYHLIEEQQKTIALANSKEFAFRVIDQAYAPERNKYVSPNRPLIIIGAALALALIGVMVWRLRFERHRPAGAES
jgi:uncharacterized protein involved in exopolysaccharide biosynthesis